MDLFSAMHKRRSARAYLDRPVPRAVIEELFEYAGMAPSAINLQPWEYVAVYGEEKGRLTARLKKAHAERSVKCGPGTSSPLPEAFSGRSREASKIMEPWISRTGIPFNRFIEEGSCSFYGAPIAVIVLMDRVFPKIRYLDVGLSVSYFMLAAEAKGLSTCPIGLITAYADQIADTLSIPEQKEVLLGIALGYADEDSPVNSFKISRVRTPDIFKWYE